MPELRTRKPTGMPSWPILLLAGVEKAGKSYAAAQAAASELIGRVFWIGVGEDDPDEYGQLADFDIVLHDGTYRGILSALEAASAQPRVDGKPNLIVVDSMSRIWSLLTDAAQETANERATRKAAQGKGRAPGPDGADISMDLWNVAKQRWGHVLDVLRAHDGPVIVTARLELVTAMKDGKPTTDKEWKVVGEKNLPFEVGAIIQLRAFGEGYLTGVRSLRYRPSPAELTRLPDDWSVDFLWQQLGLAEGAGARSHATVHAQGADAERAALLGRIKAAAEAAGVPLGQISEEWAASHDGQHIAEATDVGGLELLLDDLTAAATRPREAAQEAPSAHLPAQEPSPAPEAQEAPTEPPAADQGAPEALPDANGDAIADLVALLDAAETVEDLRSVWRMAGANGIRNQPYPDGSGATIGQEIMRRQKLAATGGPRDRDHAEAAAGS